MKKRYEIPDLDMETWLLSEAISNELNLSLGKDENIDGSDEENWDNWE